MLFTRAHLSGSPIECSWCGTTYARHQTNCTNCGGTLPGPSPPDPGPEPPPPPREIPRAYVRHLSVTGNVPALIGGVFVAVGLPITALPVVLSVVLGEEHIAWFGGTGLIFVLVGLPLLISGTRRAKTQLHALREGIATRGTITELYQDTRESINGRHPWAVEYSYEVHGRHYEGTIRSWAKSGSILVLYAVGSPVHVLYVREEPEKSALYPPIR